MLAVAARGHALSIDGFDRAHGVTLDAGDLHQAADGIAGQAKVMLHADLGRVFHLVDIASQHGCEPSGRHGACDADFALAADFGAGDRSIFFVQNANGACGQ